MTSITVHGITDRLSRKNERYSTVLTTAKDAFSEAEAIFTDEKFLSRSDWNLKERSHAGDIVHSKMTDRGKMFSMKAALPCSVTLAMDEAWHGFSRLSEWNKGVSYAHKIATLSENVDIVAGREIVCVRIRRPLPGGGFILACRSVELISYPEHSGKIRANVLVNAAWTRPDPSAPNERTLCDSIHLVDLRGLLPKMLVNKVFPFSMLKATETHKERYRELARKAAAGRNSIH